MLLQSDLICNILRAAQSVQAHNASWNGVPASEEVENNSFET